MNTEQHEAAETAETQVDAQTLNELFCDGLTPLEIPGLRSNGLRSRLLSRVRESARHHCGLLTVRARDGSWRNVKAGIRAKLLWDGPQGASVLIEFAPGAALPMHRHQHLEEGIVLDGGLQLGDLNLGPGDYHVSPAGSRHGSISSRAGGRAYLRGTSLGDTGAVIAELVSALIPGAGPPSRTIVADASGWEEIAPGVEQKILWRDGETVSRFCRLAAGARVPAHLHDGDEECLMLSGDLFFGDLLVQAGDFHLAPSGSEHGEVVSDHGALLFVRGHAPLPLQR